MNVHNRPYQTTDRTARSSHYAPREPTPYFSVFAGIGGFELGIGNRGVCVGYSEVNKHALQIYQQHFPMHRNYGDVTAIHPESLPDFELLVGGFPCQSFSIAGKRAGFSDMRGSLFFEIARLARAKQPRLLLLENVKGLLSHDHGRTFDVIVCALDELGYDLQWQVLNSKDFGVPQNRERVFIVGHLRGTPRPEIFPLSGQGCSDPEPRRHAPRHPQTYIATRHLGRNGRLIGPIANTVQACEIPHFTDGSSIRRATPLEIARLQGFPDDWHVGVADRAAYHCYGNAVTVNVVRAIAGRLLSPSEISAEVFV